MTKEFLSLALELNDLPHLYMHQNYNSTAVDRLSFECCCL